MRVNAKGRFEETYDEALERMRNGAIHRDEFLARIQNEFWRMRETFGPVDKDVIRQYAPGSLNGRFRACLLSLLTNGGIDVEGD